MTTTYYHAPGPTSQTARDLGILGIVIVVLVVLINVGSQVVWSVPVSAGNTPINNTDEVLADAQVRFEEYVDAQATRVAEGARCYFYRPLGPTQGALLAPGSIPGGLPGGEGVVATDMLMCGPVELMDNPYGSLPGAESEPWLTGLVYYRPVDSNTAFEGEFQTLMQAPLGVTSVGGGVTAKRLLTADGKHPAGDDIESPTWREVTPTGEPPPRGLPGSDSSSDLGIPEDDE